MNTNIFTKHIYLYQTKMNSFNATMTAFLQICTHFDLARFCCKPVQKIQSTYCVLVTSKKADRLIFSSWNYWHHWAFNIRIQFLKIRDPLPPTKKNSACVNRGNPYQGTHIGGPISSQAAYLRVLNFIFSSYNILQDIE